MLSTPSTMKLLSELRRPFTLNEASRLRCSSGERPATAAPDRHSPAVQRQVDDGGALDHLAAVARFGFERLRSPSPDGLGDIADLQSQIHALPRIDGQRERVGADLLESGSFRGDAVVADALVNKKM